ncbi:MULTISPECIES: hypothetical protein [Bacillus]|uniref:hypothetical protein n=1 Tax=Bacillus TaxID=1386 RepID=UPI001CCBE985|nr:hypothetical protein [Bacillus sp. RAR_M1_44]MCA0163256.1 hypothetical protein [Bacillus sp. RAR_M1_44]
MNVLEFISSIINTIIWPIFIFVAILILKTPITELIKNIAKIKYKDFELELIDKKLNEFTISSVPSNVELEMENLEAAKDDFDVIRKQINLKGPRFPVVLAYRYVTSRLVDLCEKHNVDVSYHDSRDLADDLFEYGIIDLKTRDSLIHLHELFSILSNYDQISESQAIKFLDASEVISLQLEIL